MAAEFESSQAALCGRPQSGAPAYQLRFVAQHNQIRVRLNRYPAVTAFVTGADTTEPSVHLF
jgi:hypothetical protein